MSEHDRGQDRHADREGRADGGGHSLSATTAALAGSTS
jgi:hypothetical protein